MSGLVTTTVIRPLKLIAIIFAFLALIMTIASVAGVGWLESTSEDNSDTWREGLWVQCNPSNACSNLQREAWQNACAALTIIAILVCPVAGALGLVALCSGDANRKTMFYRISAILLIVGGVCQTLTLIIFPAVFMATAVHTRPTQFTMWYFGWSYGVGWGGVFFMIAGIILFLMKRETQQVYRSEKAYYINGMVETAEA